MFLRYLSLTLLVVLASSSVFTVSASDPAEDARLISTATQDEPRKIPEDNTAYFSRSERKVRFQLVKLSSKNDETLAGTNVTVVDPEGKSTKIAADENGVATLDVGRSGLYALVTAGKTGHTAMPFALRETDAPAGEEPTLPAPTVKLSLMDIDPKEVVRLTSSYLPPEMSGSYDDIDSRIVSTGDVVKSVQYRVRLAANGSLDGQVYSLLRDGLSTSGVAGTNILFYRGNQLVTRRRVDASGKFTLPKFAPGVYGVIGVGPAGYSAFAFEAYDSDAIASSGVADQTLVTKPESNLQLTSTAQQGTVLPIVLIPPALVGPVVQQIRNWMQQNPTDTGPLGPGGVGPGGVGPGGAGAGGAGAGGVGGGGLGGAAGAGAGGLGGAGGLLGLAAAGGVAAAVVGGVNSSNDNAPVIATNGSL